MGTLSLPIETVDQSIHVGKTTVFIEICFPFYGLYLNF